jgi:3-oxoadipate enol-lactonase
MVNGTRETSARPTSGGVNAEQEHATTRDGTRLVYKLHAGGARRPRIALLHSLAMDRRFWAPVVQRLIPHADVLIYDARGHGESGKPAGPYTVELFADDLADLLDHVGWRSAAVAGASMGGGVALAFASRYGNRTDALGLIDTAAWYGADGARNWAERAARAQTAGLGDLVGFQKSRWFADDFQAQHPEVVNECVEIFLKNDLQAYAATCNMLGSCDLRAALPQLRMPTVVIVGEEDYAAPVAIAQSLHDGIAGSRLTIIKGARHLTPLECPDLVVENLVALLSQVGQ